MDPHQRVHLRRLLIGQDELGAAGPVSRMPPLEEPSVGVPIRRREPLTHRRRNNTTLGSAGRRHPFHESATLRACLDPSQRFQRAYRARPFFRHRSVVAPRLAGREQPTIQSCSHSIPHEQLHLGKPKSETAGADSQEQSRATESRLMSSAAVAGADGLLAVGGAQAIAALAFGVFSPPCDVVVGPGNRWVTAAKKHLFGEIGIDGLAGPSEIVVIANGTSDPRLVAADLLAQAEHDPDAVPILITDEPHLVLQVEEILIEGLVSLCTAAVASPALNGGYAIVVKDLDEAIDLCDRIAPEHLALHVEAPHTIAARLSDYGSLFIGDVSAEVFADYGAGPNHVLPTGGGARFQSDLSVATFLRSPTWMTISQPEMMSSDAAQFARLEGLQGHIRAPIYVSKPVSAPVAVVDLGSGQRDGSTRPVHRRHRRRRLLLRSEEPVAAGHQRKHQPTPRSILPQRLRHVQAHPTRPR